MNTKRRVRLQKVIAQSGLASRREAEQWIASGRVQVNGSVVSEMGVTVDPDADKITVNGRPLKRSSAVYYYLYHKPKNVVVARRDPQARPIIYDFLKDLPTLLHPVGRLDFDSEGLLLMTNDGELIHRLTHPSSEVPKTYHAKVKGMVRPSALSQLKKGVRLDDGPARAVHARRIKDNPNNSWLEIVVTEGRQRMVRRMCEAVGHPVLRLKRVAIGDLHLGKLKVGEYRELTGQEKKLICGS